MCAVGRRFPASIHATGLLVEHQGGGPARLGTNSRLPSNLDPSGGFEPGKDM